MERRASPPGHHSAGELRLLRDLYNFAPLVSPTLRASAVWHLLLMAVRTLRQRVRRKRVMRPPSSGAPLRMSAFRIRHDDSFLSPQLLLIQLIPYLFQRRPPRVFHLDHARALNFIQILAAVRTQPFAIVAANRLQRQRQQHLLAQHVFQQQPFALVVPDLRFRVRNRKLFVPRVRSQRPVQQIETALHLVHNRIEAPRTRHFQARLQLALYPYILHHLVLAVMLFDQIRPPRTAQRRPLQHIRPQINRTRAQFLPEINRVNFQILKFDEHWSLEPPPPPLQLPQRPAEVRTETKVSQGAISKNKGLKTWCQGRAYTESGPS